MRTRVILAALVAVSCEARQREPTVILPPLPLPSSAPTVSSPPPPRSDPMRAIVLGGPAGVQNAAWGRDGAVAITPTELWLFRPEQPDVIRTTRLARPVGQSPVLAVARPSGRLAVALEDGSIDVIEADGQRLRTLSPGRAVLELRFSPDGKTLAVTRTHDVKNEWFSRTTLLDVASSRAKSTVDGGGVVFDRDGLRIAARGGVYEVEGGRQVAAWREGFHVLLDAGVMGDMKSAGAGREVMAGDYVARGFFGDSAFYANAMGKDVAIIDPLGQTTRIAASCAPGRKVASVADAGRGRVIGVCTDGVTITDLAKRTSARITFPVLKTVGLTPPDVLLPPDGSVFAVSGFDYPMAIVDPRSGTARAASNEEWYAHERYGARQVCAGPAGARTDVHCDNPAWRADGAFQLKVHWGFRVTSRSGANVIDWGMVPAAVREAEVTMESIRSDEGTRVEWRAGGVDVRTNKRALRYRLGPAIDAESATFRATAACGKDPQPIHAEDRFAVYSAHEVKGDRVTSSITCHCSVRGCVRSVTAGIGSPIAAMEDGTLITTTLNSYHTETLVELLRPGKPATRRKVPGGCLYGAFGPSQHAFIACDLDDREEIVELALPDLSIVGRHAAPPLGRRISGMLRADTGVVALSAGLRGHFGATLGHEWFASGQPLRETPLLYAWPTFGILQDADGKLQIAGDRDAAASAIRCFDGTRLRPFDDCRGNVLRQP